jgi:hypothetical protein
VILLCAIHESGAIAQSSGRPTQDVTLSYVCPMAKDADVVEGMPGKCPKCGMTLVPVRLESAWSCPTHPTVVREKPGKCPIDKRDLVQIVASVYFTCPGRQELKALMPDKCPDGQPQVRVFERRPHGDHNPRHGGQFFMADDNWHHLEGTYRGAHLFRMYFYNDFTQPIPPKGFSGTITLVDGSDKEIGAPIPLKPTTVRNALDARVTSTKLPLKLKARVRFAPTDKQRVFDFAFSEVSKDAAAAPRKRSIANPESDVSASLLASPKVSASSTAAVPASQGQPGWPTPPSLPVQSDLPTSGIAATGIVLPTTTEDLLAELTKQASQVESLLGQGDLGAVWFPAIAAKDVALALVENHGNELTDRQRVIASSAEKRIVLAAWEIDTGGDLGDKQRVTDAYKVFAAAVADIEAAYASTH